MVLVFQAVNISAMKLGILIQEQMEIDPFCKEAVQGIAVFGTWVLTSFHRQHLVKIGN